MHRRSSFHSPSPSQHLSGQVFGRIVALIVLCATVGANAQATPPPASVERPTETGSHTQPAAVAQAGGAIAPSGIGSTLAAIRAAGVLSCGVDFEEAEYSLKDAHGNHSAFDLGLCKAIAVAVLGPNARFNAVPYRAEQDALDGLAAHQIDVLATGSVDYMNTAAHHVGFTRPVFYDSQAFLVNASSGIHSSADLAGKKVCFLVGTEIEVEIQGYVKRRNIAWLPFPFSEEGEMEAAMITGNCDAITADQSQLAYERIAFRGMANRFEILPDIVAKDPLASAYRTDDLQWAQTVDWIVQALIQAEESGITQANAATIRQSRPDDPTIQRLLGGQHGYGQYIGLDDDWAMRAIGAVGNYGELYDHTLGLHSPMRLPRGQNALWNDGGLMIADPIR